MLRTPKTPTVTMMVMPVLIETKLWVVVIVYQTGYKGQNRGNSRITPQTVYIQQHAKK